jgi:methionyl-tRNA formyltransferase
MMDEELDAGDIVMQRAVTVGPTDTATDLFHKTVELIAPVTIGALDLIASGKAEFIKQDRSQATFFHKRAEEDIRVDWNWPAEDLERLVRAQSAPYPSAFTFHKGRRLEIVSAVVSEGRYGGTPGRIFYREGEGVAIVAGADARTGRNHGLAITRVRTDDGRELPATEYFTSMGGYLTNRP